MHQMQGHQQPGEVRVVDLHQMVTEGHRESLKDHLNAVVDLSKRIGSERVVDIIMDMIMGIIIIGDHHVVVVGITIMMRKERMPLNRSVVIIEEVVIGVEEEAPIITTGRRRRGWGGQPANRRCLGRPADGSKGLAEQGWREKRR